MDQKEKFVFDKVESVLELMTQKYQDLENKYREKEQEVEKWKRTAASAHELYLKQKARADTLDNRVLKVKHGTIINE